MRSTITLFVLTFVILGLLLGIATSYDAPLEDRNPAIQQKLFEDCIKDAREDGKLTDDEYFRCAYDIYD